MQLLNHLPDWLVACFRIALLGEIYRDIRAIAIGYDGDKTVLIRYYLDREPTDFDFNNIEIVAMNFDALGGKNKDIRTINLECIFSKSAMGNLDQLTGFLYSRREGC